MSEREIDTERGGGIERGAEAHTTLTDVSTLPRARTHTHTRTQARARAHINAHAKAHTNASTRHTQKHRKGKHSAHAFNTSTPWHTQTYSDRLHAETHTRQPPPPAGGGGSDSELKPGRGGSGGGS